ncbi:Cupredoxin, partial [Coprinopsis sp. MPI-PUGE-AT-0042]
FKTFLFALSAGIPLTLAATFDVQVGPGGQNVFDPKTISNVVAGDIVNFIFHPKSHTATQSTFDAPCVAAPEGFTSSVVTTDVAASTVHQFSLPADYDGAPRWFYCGVGQHCQNGMVFAINAPAAPNERSFEAFEALARGGTPASPAPSGSTTAAPDASATTEAGAPTATGEPTIHTIVVGGEGALTYEPSTLQAKIGDTVTFQFQSKNHTATRSTFANPCQAVQGGFRSGFRPFSDTAAAADLQFSITINDTNPIWGFCAQGTHCQNGMVFSINAPTSGAETFATFQAKA